MRGAELVREQEKVDAFRLQPVVGANKHIAAAIPAPNNLD